jgi:hypothetical protein
MTGLEIIFTLSALALLGVWSWFIVLGFRTSRVWGVGLIFLFPVLPLMFIYRFERKTRRILYPFFGSVLFFAILNSYIVFTNAEFFHNFAGKMSKAIPHIDFSFKKPAEVKKLYLPPPAPIPPPLSESETAKESADVVIEEPSSPSLMQNSRYKTIAIENAGHYLGKKVIITTAFVVHRGKLISADGSQIEIKKQIAGGSTIMGISKSKVEKIEVYL